MKSNHSTTLWSGRSVSVAERTAADLFLADLLGKNAVRSARFSTATNVRRARNAEADRISDAELPSEVAPGPLNAVVRLPNDKAYFFYGAEYVRYDIKADRTDPGYPKAISGNWPGLFASGVGATLDWGNGKLYCFSGDQYTRYDIKSDRADPGFPKKIADNWPGLFKDGIDAAVDWGNGKAYFFKGEDYIRYDKKADRADPGFPKKIAGQWPGLSFPTEVADQTPILAAGDFDAAINWGDGKVYFFKGTQYIRYDVKADRADANYPKPIAGNWRGLPPLSSCACSNGLTHNYASGVVPTANLIGTKSTIKTSYGKVCCDGTTATSSAFKVAWTGVTSDTGTMTWAQTGYGRERRSGSASVNNYRYWEVMGTSYHVKYDLVNAPQEGSLHTYQCELDRAKGSWAFAYDGNEWDNVSEPGWKNGSGTRADFTGEICTDTDDMPGVAANKCTFRECQKKSVGGNYVDAGLTAAHVSSTDATKWGAKRVSASALDIWDKNPLP